MVSQLEFLCGRLYIGFGSINEVKEAYSQYGATRVGQQIANFYGPVNENQRLQHFDDGPVTRTDQQRLPNSLLSQGLHRMLFDEANGEQQLKHAEENDVDHLVCVDQFRPAPQL